MSAPSGARKKTVKTASSSNSRQQEPTFEFEHLEALLDALVKTQLHYGDKYPEHVLELLKKNESIPSTHLPYATAKLQEIVDKIHNPKLPALKGGRGEDKKAFEDRMSKITWDYVTGKSQGTITNFPVKVRYDVLAAICIHNGSKSSATADLYQRYGNVINKATLQAMVKDMWEMLRSSDESGPLSKETLKDLQKQLTESDSEVVGDFMYHCENVYKRGIEKGVFQKDLTFKAHTLNKYRSGSRSHSRSGHGHTRAPRRAGTGASQG
jgi:hypothetical protein